MGGFHLFPSHNSFIFSSSKARPRGEPRLIIHARTTLILIHTITTRAGQLPPYAILCVYVCVCGERGVSGKWLFCHWLAVWMAGDVCLSLSLTHTHPVPPSPSPSPSVEYTSLLHHFQTRQMSSRPVATCWPATQDLPGFFGGLLGGGSRVIDSLWPAPPPQPLP